MALSDKNIIITPNIGQAADPKIQFIGADSSTGAQTITLNVYPTSGGMISFEGSSGQLFSITNSLTGTIYSVTDVSGVPSIEVLDSGLVKLAQYNGNVLIGTGTNLGSRVHISSGTPSGVGAMPSGVVTTQSSSGNNYLLFRNTADNATYAGLVFQDNNIGGYVLFGNYGATPSDTLAIAGYQGGILQYGSSDTVNPANRTTVASWNSTGLQVNNGDFRTPFIYDSNDTGYYVDPNSMSRMSRVDPDEIYNHGWFRSHYSGKGLYNQANGTHFYSNGGSAWAITGSGGNVELQFRSNHESTMRGYVYANTGGSIGFLDYNGNWRIRGDGANVELYGGTYIDTGYAYIIYDRNDTAYYVDPRSTSRMSGLRLDGVDNNASGDDAILWINKPNNNDWAIIVGGSLEYGLDLRMASSHSYAIRTQASGGEYARWGSDYIYHSSSIRAPIFYDTNDTAYYVDPHSWSRLSHANIAGAPSGRTLSLGSDNLDRVEADTNRSSLVINAPYYPHLYINAVSNASNTNHGAVLSMTGVLSGGGYRRWGMGIANTDPDCFSWGYYDNQTNPHYGVGGTFGYTGTNSKMWLNTGGHLWSTGSMRAPIWYDSDDTGYYCNPNGTSSLINIEAARYATSQGSQSPDNSHPGYGMRPFYSWNIGQANNSSAGYSNGITIGSHPGDQAYGWQIVQNMWDDATYTRRYNSGWQSWYKLQWINSWMGSSLIHEDGRHYATILYDSNDSGYYLDPNSYSYVSSLRAGSYLASSGNIYTDSNYGYGHVGVYTSTRYQGVFAMGDSYKLPADGTTTGSLYGIAWSHPNAGGVAANLNTHGMLVMENGGFLAAVSGSIRCRDDMRAPIYYDSNDTGRYLDLTSVSSANTNLDGEWRFRSNRNTDSSSPPLQAYGDNGSGAIMSFHRSGAYAVNFGLDSDNVIRIGGWSASANRLQMDMSGNLTMAGNVTAYSDERLKKDWALLPDDYVERLAQIKSGTYTRIDSEERQVGVSAQDFQLLLTEAVSKDNSGMLSVSYGNAALASSVELAKRIVKQQTEINELKALVAQLLAK